MIEPTDADLGKHVIYKRDWMQPKDWEHGVITSFNEKFVFVRYGTGTISKATRREDLYWATKTVLIKRNGKWKQILPLSPIPRKGECNESRTSEKKRAMAPHGDRSARSLR